MSTLTEWAFLTYLLFIFKCKIDDAVKKIILFDIHEKYNNLWLIAATIIRCHFYFNKKYIYIYMILKKEILIII